MADQFDKMMNATCSIQKRDPNAQKDAYNQPSTALVSVEDNVPCRVSVMSGGREYKEDKNYSLDRSKIFMRLRAFDVTPHHVIVVGTTKYDILSVQNPSGMNHHLEIVVQEIKA